MSHEEIKYFYDQNPNLTLKELSAISGLSIPALKKILMGG